MRRIKAFLRLVFGFSSTETNAFVVLLPLMLIVVVSAPVYRTFFMSNYPDDFKEQAELDSVVASWIWVETKKENRADSSSGLPFKKGKKVFEKPYKPPRKQQEKFDLNLADTTQLKSIYGIGPVIARRIVAYRSSLGGFIMHGQLYEVWGLDSTVVSRLADKSVIAPDFTPVKLPINHCGEQELARHPYLRTKLARAIVSYRLQHGSFQAVDDLTKIAALDEKAFQRIKPYIRLD